MRSRKELAVFFLTAGSIDSYAVRCLAVSRELTRRGYESKCLQSAALPRGIPNLLKQRESWKRVVEARPDVLVLHRSSNPVDHEMVKKIKKQGTRVIFDYDDALFELKLLGRMASYSHLRKILSMSDAVTAGSHYLSEFASKLNKNVILVPSAVDLALFNPSVRHASRGAGVTIGWLGAGTRYQVPYLKILKDPLATVARTYDFKLKIVSGLSQAVRAEFTDQPFAVDFGLDHWVPIDQIPELIADFDIGVMPLTDDPWSRGKCAMKLLEYMAMKLATVSSAVGENRYVIDHGCNGFLASSPREWTDDIERLIADPDLREELGENGYKTVNEHYSLQAVVDTLERVIKELYDTEPT
jgi:glycosyltransferase involved in cell wall biosynthesis